VKDQATSTKQVTGLEAPEQFKGDFWRRENLKFDEPHFRLRKAARIINKIAAGRECHLLDIGCGPAALRHVIDRNIHYYGMDIAIQDPEAANLLEADFTKQPIRFGDRKFNIVIGQGIFEYVGKVQDQKFDEIREILREDGTFLVTYWNFAHINKRVYEAFSNVQSIDDFRRSLERRFTINRFFPASHNWQHRGPGRKPVTAVQMHFNVNIPVISPKLAVEYFFICSPK
jgi:cyclopropane fatty-acyl-phospholipid synthase-like methyltransferase